MSQSGELDYRCGFTDTQTHHRCVESRGIRGHTAEWRPFYCTAHKHVSARNSKLLIKQLKQALVKGQIRGVLPMVEEDAQHVLNRITWISPQGRKSRPKIFCSQDGKYLTVDRYADLATLFLPSLKVVDNLAQSSSDEEQDEGLPDVHQHLEVQGLHHLAEAAARNAEQDANNERTQDTKELRSVHDDVKGKLRNRKPWCPWVKDWKGNVIPAAERGSPPSSTSEDVGPDAQQALQGTQSRGEQQENGGNQAAAHKPQGTDTQPVRYGAITSSESGVSRAKTRLLAEAQPLGGDSQAQQALKPNSATEQEQDLCIDDLSAQANGDADLGRPSAAVDRLQEGELHENEILEAGARGLEMFAELELTRPLQEAVRAASAKLLKARQRTLAAANSLQADLKELPSRLGDMDWFKELSDKHKPERLAACADMESAEAQHEAAEYRQKQKDFELQEDGAVYSFCLEMQSHVARLVKQKASQP
ncbi:hypothetical protein WJX73_009747 [Symbiochloris irregularis]|uniref:Uncharacterized protein n=1 Tax=Symbiochloris irregularis TaxID=706552 RepID=A0AAW1PR63_9CHLO